MGRILHAIVCLAFLGCLQFLVLPACGKCYGMGTGRQTATDTIHSLEKIILGGVSQTVLITGKDTSRPILLLIHGGPGFSELLLFRTYNAELDNDYVVVNWDQRGTGLSYNDSIPRQSMNINQFVADAHELVTMLRQRFHRKKIFVAAHSWGSVIGINLVQRYPADFYAYISIGQVVNMMENERITTDFAMRMAKKGNNPQAIADLNSIAGKYPAGDEQGLKALRLQRKWFSYYGGDVYDLKSKSNLFSNITAREKSLYSDSVSDAGESFSLSSLWGQLLQIDFPKTAPVLEVPVYFVVGRHDYNTAFSLTEKYCKQLRAPFKKLVWFEKSGHMIPFEEPAKFNALMKKIVADTRR